MSQDKATPEVFLRQIGDPTTLRAKVGAGFALELRPRVNAHIHLPPNFSAFDTVAQALELAGSEGVEALGASNYYDYQVYADFIAEADKRGIFPLFGLEIIALLEDLAAANVKLNDPGNPGKLYICGKGVTRLDPMNEEATRLLQVIRDKDSARMAKMTERLGEVFDAAGIATGLNEAAVITRIADRHGCPRETIYLQERHAAQAFQERFFESVAPKDRAEKLAQIFGVASKVAADDAPGVQNEIRSHLMKAGKPAYVAETFVDFQHAYRLILALGGIPCYPTLADGATPISPYEVPVSALIAKTKARGIYFAEFIPIRNRPEVLREYVTAIRAAGIVVTAGTEHNTLDLIPIEPTCVQSIPIPDEVQEIFWEGVCVVAAHQYLTAYGETGYVDSEGRLNSAYATDEERISAFKALGQAVIRQYQENRA